MKRVQVGNDVIEFPAEMPDADIEKVLATQYAPKKQTPSAGLAPTFASGFNRGVAGLLGLPADTVANVLDLLKAPVGIAYREATGKPIPDALAPFDRSQLPLTGAWNARQIEKVLPGATSYGAEDNPLTYAAGVGAGSSLLPAKAPTGAGPLAVKPVPLGVSQARAQAAQLGMGAASSTAAALTGELGGSNEAQILVSLFPQAMNSGTAATVRKTLGAAPQTIRERAQAFRDAGVESPSVGLVTGNKTAAGIENLLANAPGSMEVMSAARDRIVSQLQAATEKARDKASTTFGPTAAGTAIQKAGERFDANQIETRRQLYDALDNFIDPQTPTSVGNTLRTLGLLNAEIKGAPATSQFFKNSTILGIENALKSDTAGAPATVMVYGRPAVGGGGLMNPPVPQDPIIVQVPQEPSRGTLPFQAAKQLRTMVGQEIADTNMASTTPRSKWNPLYGALTDDLRNAAYAASPEAARAFDRATDFTRAGAQRADVIQPFVKASSPERAYGMVENLGKGELSTFRAVKKSVDEGTRAQIAATKIDRLGRANPSAQTNEGNAWSPETFLTRWNQMDRGVRAELLSGFPNAPQVAKDLDAIARAANMMRDSSKVWANPSGTSGNIAARTGIGTTVAAVFLSPFVPGAGTAAAVGAGTMLGSNVMARLMTSPRFINWLARGTTIPPQRAAEHLSRLAIMANNSQDKQFKEDIAAYVQSLQQAGNQ